MISTLKMAMRSISTTAFYVIGFSRTQKKASSSYPICRRPRFYVCKLQNPDALSGHAAVQAAQALVNED